MIKKNFEEEVMILYKRGDLNINMSSIKSVGYKNMWNYIDNKINYNNMIEKSIYDNLKLIKKQNTWINNWKYNVKNI